MSPVRFWFLMAMANLCGMWMMIFSSWLQDARHDCPVVPYPVTVTLIERIGV